MEPAEKKECFVCRSKTQSLNCAKNIKQQQECTRFYKLVCRYLNLDTGLLPDSFSSLKATLSLTERNCLDDTIFCCETCVTIIKSFSDTYNSWKILQLQLNWKLQTIKNLMLVKSKIVDIKSSTKESNQPNFRKKFLTFANRKTREFPRLIIPKVELTSPSLSKANITAQSTELSNRCESIDISNSENDYDDFVDRDVQENYNREQEPEKNRRTRNKSKVKQNQKVIKCRFCNMQFSKKFNQQRHEIRRHNVEPPQEKKVVIYKCDVCGKPYQSKDALKRHAGIHTSLKPYQCTICKKRFRLHFSCKRHEIGHSKPEMTPHYEYNESEKQNLKDICTFCGRRFPNKYNLVSHLRIHTREKPFLCRHCNEEFSYKKAQVNHELIHKLSESNNLIKSEQDFNVDHNFSHETIRVRIVSSVNVATESDVHDEDFTAE